MVLPILFEGSLWWNPWNKSLTVALITEFSVSVLKKFRTNLFDCIVHFWRVTLFKINGRGIIVIPDNMVSKMWSGKSWITDLSVAAQTVLTHDPSFIIWRSLYGIKHVGEIIRGKENEVSTLFQVKIRSKCHYSYLDNDTIYYLGNLFSSWNFDLLVVYTEWYSRRVTRTFHIGTCLNTANICSHYLILRMRTYQSITERKQRYTEKRKNIKSLWERHWHKT